MNRIPGWLYNTGDRRELFLTEAELDAAIADGWKQSPADVVEGDEKADLIAKAEALGIEVDKRWGVQKLKDAIAGAE